MSCSSPRTLVHVLSTCLVLVVLSIVPGTALSQSSGPGLSDGGDGERSARRGRRAAEPETPEGLYATGLRQMKMGSWDEAILSFDRVRNHFPFNQYSVLAELRAADCLYEKGSYLEAADAYRGFARLHPRHAELDYVIYRTARSEFKLAPNVAQRDQTHTRRGLKKLTGYDDRFPESEYLPEVQKLRAKAVGRLARAAVGIGNFYWKQKEWAAAERRYELAIEEFPSSPLMPKARFRRGLCLWELSLLADDEADREELRANAVLLVKAVAASEDGSRLGRAASAFLGRHSLNGN